MQKTSTKNTTQTTLDSVMQQKSKQKTYHNLTSWLEDSHVKHFLMQEKEEGSMTPEELSFLKSQGFSETKNPNIFYSKTLKAYYLTTKEELSRQSLGHSPTWGIMCLGRYITARTMESPKTGNVYTLKDFLERERESGREVLCQQESGRQVDVQQEIIQLNDTSKQALRVMRPDGISTTLCGNAGGLGGKTGLYQIESSPIKKVGNVSLTGHGSGDVYSCEGICRTLLARDYKDAPKVLLKNNTRKGYLEAGEGDGVILTQPNCRGRVQKEQSPTITTKSEVGTVEYDVGEAVELQSTRKYSPNLGRGELAQTVRTNKNNRVVTENYRIRRLTPIETERLQGFPDNYTKYGANGDIISDTQRYKCCGNAVTTTVISYIMNNWRMYDAGEEDYI